MEKSSICVYTCITGNYDNLKEIPNIEEGIDYYCFTNNQNIKSSTWKVIYIYDENLSNVQLARKIKILGNDIVNNYDIALWMDGAVIFNKSIKKFINHYLGKGDNFVAFAHGERNNIKDEAYACYRFFKETKENIDKVLDFYDQENYKYDNGLIESTVYIKRPQNELVKKTMEMWFDMILKFTKRDQLSFNYCIYKTGLKVKWINEKVFANDWFNWKNHAPTSNIDSYSIYFGDINHYDIKNDVKGKYNISNNTYSFKEKVIRNTNEIYIIVSNVNFIYYDNVIIKGLKKDDYTIYNTINYNDKDVIYANEFIIGINKQYKKGEIIDFSICMEVLDYDDKINLIKVLGDEVVLSRHKLKELNNSIEDKNKYIDKLWKTINSSYLCRIGLKWHRKKNI